MPITADTVPQLPVGQLWVGHWPHDGAKSPALPRQATILVVETCLRRLAVTLHPESRQQLADHAPPETYQGIRAYRFLLEVATGLKSAVPGETNVFGQVRRAWEEHRRHAGPLSGLDALLARLVSDTRAIRREHLQNIGGASYGALVRKLLRPAEGDRVLLVGAGELARSMLPFFGTCRVGLWSRRPPDAALGNVEILFGADDASDAARWAQHVVLTTPGDAVNDQRWIHSLDDGLPRRMVHLGQRRGAGAGWPASLRLYDLDDVFDLRRSQENVRHLQIERARCACRERARQLAATIGPRAGHRAAG